MRCKIKNLKYIIIKHRNIKIPTSRITYIGIYGNEITIEYNDTDMNKITFSDISDNVIFEF